MDGDEALVAHLAGGGEGGVDLGGVVGVVVHDDRTVALTVELKAAARALEVQGSLGALLHGQAHKAADGTHGQRIINVVAAGHGQADVAGDFAPLLEVELKEAGLVLLHIDGAVVAVVLDAKGADAAVQRVHDIHGVLVVGVGEDHELGHQGEALEGELQLTHAAVVVQMIVVDVQHNGQVGGQFEEGLGILAGLDDDVIALTGLAVAVDEGQLAADDRRRVPARQLQHCGDHAGGRRLAVGAGDADAVLVQAADIAQQDAALHGGDAVGIGGVQLHVVLRDGGRVDHEVGADDVVGVMAQRDLHAHLPLVADDAAIQHITAGDDISLGVQDLDQRVHAAAAAADEVDLLHIIKQVLGIVGNKHIQATSK